MTIQQRTAKHRLTIGLLSYLFGDSRDIEVFHGDNSCADIHVSPSGLFLYGSNRGHDSIVSYCIDQKTGKLDCLGYTSTQGRTSRNFVIDPTGEFLLAANQDSDSVISFGLDQQTGELQPTGFQADIPSPDCIKICS